MDSIADIRRFGAEPGGSRDASAAIAGALEYLKSKGGGTLLVPEGIFLCGPIELPSDTTLYLDTGACLRFSNDFSSYPPVESRWEGISCWAMHPLVFARNARNVAIRGEGTLDGQGAAWWAAHKRKKAERQAGPETEAELRLAALNGGTADQPSGGGGRETQFLRPPLVQFLSCDRVVVEGVSLVNSPFWTLHPVFTSRLRVENVSISNPPDAPNTDGIDIDSCSEVTISGCLVDVGDDCIALKSGSGPGGVALAKPTRDVEIRRCTFLNGHGGVVIGSETAGGVENLEVADCRFLGSDRGVRMKSRRGRGGTVQNLVFRNLVMDSVLAPITLNMYYNCGSKRDEAGKLFSLDALIADELTPRFRNIIISNLVATRCRASAGFIVGLPESKVENLSLENCLIELAVSPDSPVESSEMYQGLPAPEGRGLRLRNAECTMKGVKVLGAGLEPNAQGILEEEGCLLSFLA
ncbi:MAG TPA: glycoside hydrolase family 28 protein [Rectinemataceae bacterium]